MFTVTINRNQLDARPFMYFALLAILIAQLGTLPTPRISVNAPAPQAVVQQTKKIMTDTASTGLVDWAKIEGVRSDADIQKIAQPTPRTKEVTGIPFWGSAHLPVRVIVNSAGINVPVQKAEIVDGQYQTTKGVANWLANGEMGRGNTLVFWAYDTGWQDRLDMPFYHLSGLNRDTDNDLGPGSVMMINDDHSNVYGYVYETMLTVRSDDTSWMAQDDANRVILIASAGDVVRDHSGRIIDTSHRRIFIFRRMHLYERVQEGLQ